MKCWGNVPPASPCHIRDPQPERWLLPPPSRGAAPTTGPARQPHLPQSRPDMELRVPAARKSGAKQFVAQLFK